MQALQDRDITIFGDGLQTRSFCSVDDLIDGVIRFMDLSGGTEGVSGFPGSLNLGNPLEFTIRALAERIIELTGARSRIVFHPLPADDPAQRKPDITRARECLGRSPEVKLEDGLKQTIAYFDERFTATA